MSPARKSEGKRLLGVVSVDEEMLLNQVSGCRLEGTDSEQALVMVLLNTLINLLVS
jgi:hypothetical protein